MLFKVPRDYILSSNEIGSSSNTGAVTDTTWTRSPARQAFVGYVDPRAHLWGECCLFSERQKSHSLSATWGLRWLSSATCTEWKSGGSNLSSILHLVICVPNIYWYVIPVHKRAFLFMLWIVPLNSKNALVRILTRGTVSRGSEREKNMDGSA